MIVIVHGVSGSGKTTIGQLLARRLNWPFFDGDDFHPPANRERMRTGVALTEEDRRPWLLELQAAIHEQQSANRDAVFAISALKKGHRALLRGDGVRLVFLDIGLEDARGRLARRRGHFFDPQLLESQFEALERPRHSLVVDASKSPAQVVDAILAGLGVPAPGV